MASEVCLPGLQFNLPLENGHTQQAEIKQQEIPTSLLSYIGQTPLIRLQKTEQSLGLPFQLFAKVEAFSAGGSIKDRIAIAMVEAAEREGRLKPGSTLIEPTSGNTGIGLALVAAVKGYKLIITLPDKMSNEKIAVMRALGAEVIRTPAAAAFDSPESHIGVARKLEREIEGAVILDQYANEANPLAHEYGTAPEIWAQTNGRVSAIVAGAGTGGTVTGLSRGLRSRKAGMKIIAADPHGSVLALPQHLNGQQGQYKVEGIGYDFVPDVLDQSQPDMWIKTDDKGAFDWARRLIREEGLLVGGSSGSAMCAAMEAWKTGAFGENDVVVVICPDGIRNYLSRFASDDWMAQNGF